MRTDLGTHRRLEMIEGSGPETSHAQTFRHHGEQVGWPGRGGAVVTGYRTAQRDPPLERGPYYIVETSPALTFGFHGIRIDAAARVHSTAGDPIDGLYATGSDIVGLYDNAHAGGIAPVLLFGLAAADTAADRPVAV